jgi:hypothetical protein
MRDAGMLCLKFIDTSIQIIKLLNLKNMEHRNNLPVDFGKLSIEEKLELFKVEELETRLEQAALLASSGVTNTVCQQPEDAACW